MVLSDDVDDQDRAGGSSEVSNEVAAIKSILKNKANAATQGPRKLSNSGVAVGFKQPNPEEARSLKQSIPK